MDRDTELSIRSKKAENIEGLTADTLAAGSVAEIQI